MKRDLISFSLWSRQELTGIFDLAHRLKNERETHSQTLRGKSAALIFERESLRTRVSFEVGIAQLGGHPIFLQQQTIGIATRESVHDIGEVLSHYNELIIARTVKHQTLIQLAEGAGVPVINAMTDLVHPCQIMADVFTLQEAGKFSPETKIVFVGDGNNIVNSWLEFAEKVPITFVYSCPAGYEPHPQILEQAKASGVSKIAAEPNPQEAVQGADVLYTDVWPETRGEGRKMNTFREYQVNANLLKGGKSDCVVMHRLPANRGEEITSDVLDGERSLVLRQAENRLHVQKGIMLSLLSNGK
ncbi:MAG: ornithine carbamoyltransferase [Ignavibacteria bacterium]|nr:ornithine carbamoyltransferase [Ignavibacteria bacterium]